jgi:hypothetical protein
MSEMTPPTTRSIESELAPTTNWPKVIGVISLIYAIGGLLCVSVYGAYIAFFPKLPEMLRGGIDMPPLVRFSSAALLALTLPVGIIMLVGAINLLRRRRSGVRGLKRWSVLRLLLLVLYVVLVVGTSRTQLEMLRQGVEFQNDMVREAGRPDRMRDVSDEALWKQFILQTSVFTAIFSFYPVFLGLYLSRRKVTSEIEAWE